MRQQARRYDEDDYQSRSPQYNKDGYQPQDNKNEYQLEGSESRDQPQGFDDGSGEYIDLPKNHHFQNGYQEEQEDGKWGDELPPNHRYYLEMQGAIFDSSSSNPFQSPGRGRTVLQGTKRTFTGLSPAGPRETPPPRQPSAFPRKRKRLLWRENGREELIHQDSPRYLPFPPDTLSSPGRGRTLRRGIRNAWASLSPNGPRKTPPPWEPSLSPRPKKRFRYLHRKEGVDERIVLPSSPSSPFYDISVPSGPLSSEYDGMYQPTEREMNNKISYIDLVSDSTGTPRTPPPRVWSLISSGPHSEEYDGFYQPTEREVRNKIPYIDLVSVSSDSDAPRTPPPKVWPKSNVMGKRNLKKRAPLNPLKSSGNGVSKHVDKKGNNVHKRNGNSVSPTGRPSITAEASSPREGESAFGSPQPAVQVASDFMRKYNFRRSRTVEAKKETEEDMPSGNGVSSGSCITSKTKGRKTPQPPNPKSTRVTRSGAVGKIAGGNAAKSCGRK
ncbi:hypothetical protein L211DRAFT_438843 [Terfezia boudieri ATCC MYA-4762]|uniref:Uncharacterized protein n=1 Tax=Terfezia boudieri ATCC MYA-4762 TaxID=1051890 RepID=A0A3N4LF39_9PEZI|nr:hypothetical protein L211DRAFT_438843 [Terfezia boudieri ATCC MYA-4762]